MPNTFIPIQTYTLGSSAASVTFSNIPQNYTDLKIVISGRDSSAVGTSDAGYSFTVLPNGLTSNIAQRSMFLGGSGFANFADTSMFNPIAMNADTANSFSNVEIYVQNYTSSNFKTFSIDGVTEINAGVASMRISSGLWSQSAAITSLQLTAFTTWMANSTFTLYGISNGVKATGGTLTVAGGYAYHTFTSTGSFLPSQQIKGAEFIVVAGGGGGGLNLGGGGGAGGLVFANSQTLNAGNTYTALIGAGGAGGILSSTTKSVNGSNSVLGSISAIGGGGGGDSATDNPSFQDGRAGGSGGGGTGYYSNATNPGGSATQGSGINFVGYGNSGGSGPGNKTPPYGNASSGGGGGAGGAGANGGSSPWAGGAGGVGSLAYSSWGAVTGTGENVSGTYYYAGGGGGSGASGTTRALGGYGGGGAGGLDGGTDSTAGTANTGGGGGGSRGNNTDGKAGGSGLIIIRYPLS